MDEITKYGFKFGPLEVIRACHDSKFYTLIIKTDHKEIQVSASAKGRKLYVAPSVSAKSGKP
jgi:hypothetical protein